MSLWGQPLKTHAPLDWPIKAIALANLAGPHAGISALTDETWKRSDTVEHRWALYTALSRDDVTRVKAPELLRPLIRKEMMAQADAAEHLRREQRDEIVMLAVDALWDLPRFGGVPSHAYDLGSGSLKPWRKLLCWGSVLRPQL